MRHENPTAARPLRLAEPGEKGIRLDAYAGRNAGFRGGVRAMRALMQWMIAEHELGRPLGDGTTLTAAVVEYSAWWGITERSGWDHLEHFRLGFPGEDTPSRLARLLRDQREVVEHGASSLARVQLIGA